MTNFLNSKIILVFNIEFKIYIWMYRFLGFLFNDMSTLMGYLILKPSFKEESSGTI